MAHLEIPRSWSLGMKREPGLDPHCATEMLSLWMKPNHILDFCGNELGFFFVTRPSASINLDSEVRTPDRPIL
jgi:hypothetical protein